MSPTHQTTMQNDDGNDHQTPLQKHTAFFDRNNDGFVYPWETYTGFRAIGAGYLLSAASAIVINVAFGPKTTSGKFPNLLFPIEVKNIQRAKHGSDSGVYDAEGRFVASKFEEIFDKFALTRKDALTSKEVKALVKANREASGRVVAWLEWKILYSLGKDSNGLLQKDTVRGVYDGTLFEKLEKERASAPKKS